MSLTVPSLKCFVFSLSSLIRDMAFLTIFAVIATDLRAETLSAATNQNINQMTRIRAIVQHKGSQETLILSLDFISSENAAENDGEVPLNKEFAWVLPIPDNSVEIHDISSLPTRMLMPITRPYRLNMRTIDLLFIPFLLTIVALIGWCCTGQQLHKRICTKLLFIGSILVSVIMSGLILFKMRYFVSVVMSVLVLFNLFTRYDTKIPAMGFFASEPLESGMTDIPQTAILRPESLEEFSEILAREYHLKMGASNSSLAAKYIDQGWSLGLIRMVIPMRASYYSSPFRTPSMAFTFSTETPILPLPLFGIRRDPLVDVLVIGETSFRCDALRLESTFRCREMPHTVAQLQKGNVPFTRLGECPVYELEGIQNLKIGFPAITKLLWDGCVLTRFSGQTTSSSDVVEMRPHAKPASSSFRVTLGRPKTIFIRSMFYATLAGVVWMTGIFLLSLSNKIRNKKILLTILILCTIPIAFSAGIAYSSQVQAVDGQFSPWQRNMTTDYLDVLVKELSGKAELTGEDAYSKIAAEVRDVVNRNKPPVDYEDDWYQLFEDNRGLICRIYDVRDDLPIEPLQFARDCPNIPPEPRANHLVWPAPEPWVTFIGEPTDIVLVEKSSPQ